MKVTDFCCDNYQIIPNTTTCKHKDGDCELCGTSNRRDVLHDTVDGVGRVGALLKKNKKK